MIGPLQLLVIGFDEDKYARDIIVELKNLRKEKIIRLFDLLYVIKHKDGTIASKEVSDLQAEEQREFGTLIKSLIGLTGKDLEHAGAEEVANSIDSAGNDFGLSELEIQDVANQIPNGSAALLVIFEHLWARGVKRAMLRAGGYVTAQGFINPETLQAATNELAIVLESINKAEAASMEKMAGVVTDAHTQEEEARLRAAEAAAEAEAIEKTAAQAVAAADLMAEEADQALTEAQAREEEARQHAAEVTAETQAAEDAAFAEVEAVRRAAVRQQEQAEAKAAEAVKQAEEIEAAAVLRALNAMVAANIIEKKAAREALRTVINANVIEASAAREAASMLSADQ